MGQPRVIGGKHNRYPRQTPEEKRRFDKNFDEIKFSPRRPTKPGRIRYKIVNGNLVELPA